MKIINVVVIAACATFGVSGAHADDTDTLIKLDKMWGEATDPAKVKSLFTGKFIALDEDGVSGKAELLQGMAEDDSPPEPYKAGDYKVEFLGKKTAVMVHSVRIGDDAHWSMHVWRKKGDNWKVAATTSIEADDD